VNDGNEKRRIIKIGLRVDNKNNQVTNRRV